MSAEVFWRRNANSVWLRLRRPGIPKFDTLKFWLRAWDLDPRLVPGKACAGEVLTEVMLLRYCSTWLWVEDLGSR